MVKNVGLSMNKRPQFFTKNEGHIIIDVLNAWKSHSNWNIRAKFPLSMSTREN